MPVEVEPPELARLLDYAERPRVDDWSLRAALCRYASPQPVRVGALLELVRRIDFGLQPHLRQVERNGPAYWQAIAGAPPGDGDGGADADVDPMAAGLLRVATVLDGYGDVLATWAVDRAGERPDAATDATITEVARRLDELGAPRETRTGPPPRGRRRQS